MSTFENKKILFFSADLFGYQIEICNALISKGFLVDYYDERPSNTFLVKSLIRINRNLLSLYINTYHLNIIEDTKDKSYDYVFVIKGESISDLSLKKIRKYHPTAILVLYLWDSIRNNKNAISHIAYFDRVLSFDKLDCDLYNLIFHPLFYISDYKNLPAIEKCIDIDFLFVATVHSDRYLFCEKIRNVVEKENKTCFFYYFFRSKLLFYKMKFLDKTFFKAKLSDFYFKSLSTIDVVDLFRRSKIIIDIQHPNQTGLTMRCIEVLGAKRKLVTTNKSICEYDFYNPNNIHVVDRNNPIISTEFIKSDYIEIPAEIYRKYELTNWLDYVFFNHYMS